MTEPARTRVGFIGLGQMARYHLDEMLPEYYSLRGWDDEGVPSAAKLEELSL